MEPSKDIANYFFTYIRSKLPKEIRFEIFYDTHTEQYAYCALKGHQVVSSGVIDNDRIDQIAYMEQLSRDITDSAVVMAELVFI